MNDKGKEENDKMKLKSVFVLQDTKECADKVAETIDSDEEFEVVGSSTDGIAAIAMIADRKPDFLVMGLVLTGYDGLCVIEKVRELNKDVKIVVLSALCREEFIAKAMELGADYFMAKPFAGGVLLERMKELADGIGGVKQTGVGVPVHQVTLDEKISKIFINVGIPPHIKGYSFLREGVKMAVEDPDIINSITKKLYPMIGKRYSTTASKVERAIRHAIEVAWNRGRIDNINSLLGVRAYVGAEKPTNGEFIALVADKMLLEKA